MVYLPDTNVWIHHLNPAPSIAKEKLSSHSPAQIVLCDVVKAELYYGAYKSARREANLAVLATHNIGEFSRIAGLKLEDWEAGE